MHRAGTASGGRPRRLRPRMAWRRLARTPGRAGRRCLALGSWRPCWRGRVIAFSGWWGCGILAAAVDRHGTSCRVTGGRPSWALGRHHCEKGAGDCERRKK